MSAVPVSRRARARAEKGPGSLSSEASVNRSRAYVGDGRAGHPQEVARHAAGQTVEQCREGNRQPRHPTGRQALGPLLIEGLEPDDLVDRAVERVPSADRRQLGVPQCPRRDRVTACSYLVCASWVRPRMTSRSACTSVSLTSPNSGSLSTSFRTSSNSGTGLSVDTLGYFRTSTRTTPPCPLPTRDPHPTCRPPSRGEAALAHPPPPASTPQAGPEVAATHR